MILGFKKSIKGKPTLFKEKILSSLGVKGYSVYTPKLHTIREDGHDRWHQFRKIQSCYGVRTKQFEKFAEMPCTGVQSIRIVYIMDHFQDLYVDGKKLTHLKIQDLAINDGFDSIEDFLIWFNKDFTGKIIHWTDKRY